MVTVRSQKKSLKRLFFLSDLHLELQDAGLLKLQIRVTHPPTPPHLTPPHPTPPWTFVTKSCVCATNGIIHRYTEELKSEIEAAKIAEAKRLESKSTSARVRYTNVASLSEATDWVLQWANWGKLGQV